ncbi:MAG TPA: carboxypeptidase regulatory-like domain-containing protein [Acidimicrobiales bacterium]
MPKSQLTDTSYCPPVNNQFRLLYHLEVAPNIYRLQASNPGQFYFNGFYFGAPDSTFTMTLQVPYPFVTQEGAGTRSRCMTAPASPRAAATCRTRRSATPEDYTPKQLGSLTTVTVTGNVPATGLAYVTIHLDYGLKKTSNWKADATTGSTINPENGTMYPNVSNAVGFGSGPITIHGYEQYGFARTVGGQTSTTTPSSYNEVKKFAGFLGYVVDNTTGQPKANAKVVIYNPSNAVIGTLYTDVDGYYMLEYKHRAKSATYTVKLPSYGKSTTVLVKANGFAAVNFDI